MKERARQTGVLIAAVLVVASFALSGWALKSRFQEGNQNRNDLTATARAQTTAIRTILCYFESLIPPNTPQHTRAALLYTHALKLIHAPPCAPNPKGPK